MAGLCFSDKVDDADTPVTRMLSVSNGYSKAVLPYLDLTLPSFSSDLLHCQFKIWWPNWKASSLKAGFLPVLFPAVLPRVRKSARHRVGTQYTLIK